MEQHINTMLGIYSLLISLVLGVLASVILQMVKNMQENRKAYLETISKLTDDNRNMSKEQIETIQYYIEEGEEREKTQIQLVEKLVKSLTLLESEVKHTREKICYFMDRKEGGKDVSKNFRREKEKEEYA